MFLACGAVLILLGGVGCDEKQPDAAARDESYAIYAEYAKGANILMKDGLNRRIFNTTEARHGGDIRLELDGSITLQPGTYQISGFSIVTMQTSLTIPDSTPRLNYPGYCLVYEAGYEQNEPLKHQLGIGSPSTALDMAPSLFQLVLTCDKVTRICVGHQSGDKLNNEVYLSVYEVDGVVSPFHVFSRIAIFKM